MFIRADQPDVIVREGGDWRYPEHRIMLAGRLESVNEMETNVWKNSLDWFNRPLGLHVLEQERRILEQVLPDLFGYHIVQVGAVHDGHFLHSSRIGHRVIMLLDREAPVGGISHLRCTPDSMAMATDSLDVVVLPHVLEFSEHPHRVLREVERVLIGEGHLVLLGFSPWSLWGMWRLLLCWREDPPWSGHFYGLGRLRDWLSLLDFELVTVRRFIYRPPCRSERIMQRLAFLDKIGKLLWPLPEGFI